MAQTSPAALRHLLQTGGLIILVAKALLHPAAVLQDKGRPPSVIVDFNAPAQRGYGEAGKV
jgi:hypothetical protein